MREIAAGKRESEARRGGREGEEEGKETRVSAAGAPKRGARFKGAVSVLTSSSARDSGSAFAVSSAVRSAAEGEGESEGEKVRR